MKKILITLLIGMSQVTMASNGLIDINVACSTISCFPGDNFAGFPVTITKSGSYQLTSNLVTTATSVNVIEIFTDNVTIDLNGFTISGPKTCTGSGSSLVCDNGTMTSDGISSIGVNNNITVKNGAIRGLDTGIALNGIGNKILNVTVSENREGMLNPDGVIIDSIANRNTRVGFGSIHNSLVASVLVKDSAARGNDSFSAIARVCSNVFFVSNGNGTTTSDAACLNYTNESTCQVAAECP